MKKGFYKVSKLDKIFFEINKKKFWNRLYNDSNDMYLNSEARLGVGLAMNNLEGDTIFVATKLALDQIDVQKTQDSIGSLSDDIIRKIKYIGVYANYLANSNVIKTILISDVARTPERQAEYVYKDTLNYPNINDTNAMYSGNVGKLARKLIQENTDTQEITNQLTNYIITNGTFRHVNNSGNTIDIATNDTRDTAKSEFTNSFAQFMKANTWLSSNNSLMKGGEGGETNAHHTVFK